MDLVIISLQRPGPGVARHEPYNRHDWLEDLPSFGRRETCLFACGGTSLSPETGMAPDVVRGIIESVSMSGTLMVLSRRRRALQLAGEVSLMSVG